MTSEPAPTSLITDPTSSVAPARPRPRNRPTQRRPLHSGVTVGRYIAIYATGAAFPLTAGFVFFGWRAIGAVGVVVISALLATLVWRRIGRRGRTLRLDHTASLGLLLALMLPAHLLGAREFTTSGPALWPILAAAGVLLVAICWTVGEGGGIAWVRVHPAIFSYLVLLICFKDALVPQYVLQRRHAFGGDILSAVPPAHLAGSKDPWVRAADVAGYDSIRFDHHDGAATAAQTLSRYTSGAESPSGAAWLTLDALLRDRLPPLEDLILGAHPSPIGAGSMIAAIIGGLFLLYRGVIDYRVPLLIFATVIVATIVLPVPVVIKENQVIWRWFAMRTGDVGWPIGLTLVSYELVAGPLGFAAFFLANSPSIRPLSKRGRTIFAVLIGTLTAVFQLYVSVAVGPYLAILLVGLFTPLVDNLCSTRPLV